MTRAEQYLADVARINREARRRAAIERRQARREFLRDAAVVALVLFAAFVLFWLASGQSFHLLLP